MKELSLDKRKVALIVITTIQRQCSVNDMKELKK